MINFQQISTINPKNFDQISSSDFEAIFDQIFEISEKLNLASNQQNHAANNSKIEQIAKFLLDLNQVNLPTNAFIGATSALKKRMISIRGQEDCLDVCGTGGDKLNTLNISTAVAFVLAGAGIKIAKHGNRAVSSKSGSADIFLELGIKFESDESAIQNSLNSCNLCFLFAPHFHPILKNLAEIRKKLAVPTIFNFLGPLLNPTNPKRQLIGSSQPNYLAKLAAVISKNPQKKAILVSGFEGMDEISLSNKSWFLACENGEIGKMQEIDPRDFGFNLIDLKAIEGGDAKFNASKLLELLEGKKSAYRDIVVLNSAFAILLANHEDSIEEAILLAQNSIDSGKAMKILEMTRNLG